MLSTALGESNATVWENGNQVFLETPESFDSSAVDISSNGDYIGGRVSFDDLTLFETIRQAAVWVDGTLNRLENADGSVFEGIVRGVSDNGYAVGESDDGAGFIWHESFVGVRMFDEWLLTEFDLTLPEVPSSLNDVLYDEVCGNLLMAGAGPSFLVSVSITDTRPFPFHNDTIASDVNNDGTVSPLDVLIVINELNRVGPHALASSRLYSEPLLDVNQDGFVSPVDALQTINLLNGPSINPSVRVISFGADIDLVGVGQQDDGDMVLVGNRFNESTGFSEGVVLTVSAVDNSVVEEVVGTFGGGDTFLSAVSPNGQFASGYSRDAALANSFEGFRVDVATPQVLTGVGALGPQNDSFAFDVSNFGVVVGTTHGGLVPFQWESSTGISGLTVPTGGGAFGVSSSGIVVGRLETGLGESGGVLWENGNQVFLETPESFNSAAVDISSNRVYVGGEVSFEDLTLFETINQAAVWVNGTLNRLESADGSVFEGIVRGVSDNGYAVGESDDGAGFIWHESFAGVRMFDEWLSTEHGVTLPTAVTSVQDVIFDGTTLAFAASGNAYLLTVPNSDLSSSPEPEGEGRNEDLEHVFAELGEQSLASGVC